MSVLAWIKRMLRGVRGEAAQNRPRAGVYARAGVLLIHSTRTTTAGVGLAGPEVHRIQSPFSPEAVGAAARAALAVFQADVPHPKKWAGVGKEFLAACGVRSWKELQKGARFCGIELSSDGVIRLSATHNGGTSGDDGGFQPNDVPDRVIASDASDHDLGTAILATIEQCS